MPVSDEVWAEAQKEITRLRKQVSQLKGEKQWLEQQMVATDKHHVEAGRREARRRAEEKFLKAVMGD